MLGSTLDPSRVLDAIDGCRGVEPVMLSLFGLQLDLDADQTACFTDQITASAARDLLRLVLFGDQARFSGTGGEVLLALCSR